MQKSFISNTSGSIGVFVALGVVALVTVVGLAIDVSSHTNIKTKFQNALDQAVLSTASAAVDSQDKMENDALKFFQSNFPESTDGTVKITSFNVTFDPSNFEWKGEATGTVKTSIGGIVGISETNLSHTAKVKWDEVTTEVVFAVDMSASMCATFDADRRRGGILKVQPDPDCKKLASVRQALNYLIKGDTEQGGTWGGLPRITTRDGRSAYKVGIVPFNHKVKLPNTSSIPDILTAQEPDPNYFKVFNADPGAAETAAYPLPTVSPLRALNSEGDRGQLLSAVESLQTRHDVPGWTRSNLGMLTAALMLDKDYSQYFGGAQPAAFDAKLNKKVVFLLTDGANMGCCFSDHPNGTYDQQYLYSYRTDNDYLDGGADVKTGGLCRAMKEKGITVFTLVYDVDDNDAQGGGARIKQVMENCASGPKDTNFFDLKIEESDRIQESYKKIASSLVRLRLSE